MKPNSLLVVAALSFGSVAGAAPTLQNVYARTGHTLDGQWHVIVDPYENGFYDYRLEPRPRGYFKNDKPQSPSDLVEYDFDRSPVLRVPICRSEPSLPWSVRRLLCMLTEFPVFEVVT